MANLLEIQKMIQAFNENEESRASEINLKLFPLFKVLFCTTNPIPIKAALNLQGWFVGGVRLPLVEISKADYDDYIAQYESYKEGFWDNRPDIDKLLGDKENTDAKS